VRTLSSGVKVGEKEPPHKKYKAEDQPKTSALISSSNVSGPKTTEASSSKNKQQMHSVQTSNSAPPKVNPNSCVIGKEPKDDQRQVKEKNKESMTNQANLSKESDMQVDRVHIPDNFDDSDAKSESLSDRLRRIGAYTEVGQRSQQNEDKENHQVWAMEVDESVDPSAQIMGNKEQELSMKSFMFMEDKMSNTERNLRLRMTQLIRP